MIQLKKFLLPREEDHLFFCMLDKNDIAILWGMFTENNSILKREIRDEMHALIKASEAGLIREIRSTEGRMITRMDSMKQEITDGVIDVIDDNILPQVQELRENVVMIKRHLKLA